jgi:hypothetical protein
VFGRLGEKHAIRTELDAIWTELPISIEYLGDLNRVDESGISTDMQVDTKKRVVAIIQGLPYETSVVGDHAHRTDRTDGSRFCGRTGGRTFRSGGRYGGFGVEAFWCILLVRSSRPNLSPRQLSHSSRHRKACRSAGAVAAIASPSLRRTS